MLWYKAWLETRSRFLISLAGIAAVCCLWVFLQDRHTPPYIPIRYYYFVLYSGYRYGWTPAILGWTFMATGISQIVVQMFLIGPIVQRVGERGAVGRASALAA